MGNPHTRASESLVACELNKDIDWSSASQETLEQELEKAGFCEGMTLFCANSGFLFREVAGESVLIPVGAEAERFNGLASLNETGAFLWKQLEQKRTFLDLVMALVKEYEVTVEQSV